MAKSRSRSPRWKPRPLPYRSPEQKRHRHIQDHYQDNNGFRRDPRRPLHWDDERHRQNNSKTGHYNRFNDKSHELDSFDSELRKTPFEAANRLKRMHSPERRGEGNRRFPAKFPDDPPHREHHKPFYNHRNQERNVHSEANGFKATRREEHFHRPYHREPDTDWRENESRWTPQDHKHHYLSPPRRGSKEFVDRNSFQKRHPEDNDFREHDHPPKRTRETERLDCRPPLRSPHWKDDHTLIPYPDKAWPKDTDLRAVSPIVYKGPSGEFTKIEYDYSHRSPSYVQTEPPLLNERTEKRSWHEERKSIPTRTSQHNRLLDINSHEKEKYTERTPDLSTKYSERRGHERAAFKNDLDMKLTNQNHKHKERGRKEDDYQKQPTSPRQLRNQSPKSPNQKVLSKISPEKETIMVNLALKKPTDNYRLPHEHWNISKDMHAKPESAQGERNYEGKQRAGDNMLRRNSTASSERQMSQDLVVIGGKEDFRPVFEHLELSKQSGINAPNNEFTQEIITIIHEVKANHFKSAEMSLHERFSKLQAESNKQDLNHNVPTLQTNPEIHRRIDISLEDLQNKSLQKSAVIPVIQKVIQDPNDLRHDIERRRKQRLHQEEGNATSADFSESDATGSCYRPQNNETGDFEQSSRMTRPTFRKSGRPPGSVYRGKSNQYDTSRIHFENTDEITRPYKGWGNPASRI